MKLLTVIPIALVGAFLACSSPLRRTETSSPLTEASGLEEVSIVSKGLE